MTNAGNRDLIRTQRGKEVSSLLTQLPWERGEGDRVSERERNASDIGLFSHISEKPGHSRGWCVW